MNLSPPTQVENVPTSSCKYPEVSQLHMMKAVVEYRSMAYSNLYLNRENICIQQISK